MVGTTSGGGRKSPSGWTLATSRLGVLGISAGLGFVFFVLYVGLRSQDYTGVDGPLRAAVVFHDNSLSFHGNNHLLYPVNILIWNNLLSLVGITAADPITYVHHSQAMNSLAGACCVGLVCWIGYRLGGTLGTALVSACGFGLARTSMLHFANSAEAPVGLLWSLLSVALVFVALEKQSLWLNFAAGSLLALAMATYQPMVLLGGMVVVLCAFHIDAATAAPPGAKLIARRLALFSLGGLATTVLTYGTAYSLIGIEGVLPKISRFVQLDGGGRTFGGLSLSKAVNVPVGLIDSLLPVIPTDYMGLRDLAGRHDGWYWYFSLGLGLVLVLVFLVATSRSVASSDSTGGPLVGRGPVYLLMSLAITIIPVVYWDPSYDKLWLLPIAAFALFVPCAIRCEPRGRAPHYVKYSGLLIVSSALVLNLWWAIPAATVTRPYVADAMYVRELVTERDLVLCGWDPVSELYKALAGTDREFVDVPSEAGGLEERFPEFMEQKIHSVRARGGRVYSIGILDQSRERWDSFLGSKVGVAYSTFSDYRDKSEEVRQFQTLEGTVVSLRVLVQ